MTYYPTLDEDLARAKEILASAHEALTDEDGRLVNDLPMILASDNYAAYKLLESFVQHIEYCHQQVEACHNHIEELETFKEHAKTLNKKAAAEIERLRLPGPLSGLQHAKYLNPACGEHGCQWLRATYENQALRDQLAAYHAAANDPEPDR